MRLALVVVAALFASPAAARPWTIDVRFGFGNTDAVGDSDQTVGVVGLDVLYRSESALVVGATADVSGGDEPEIDDKYPHGHLGALLGVGQRFGRFGFLLLAELGAHGIGEIGDSAGAGADTVRLGYLGVRTGVDVTFWGFFAAGTSLSFRRDLAHTEGFVRPAGAPGFVPVAVGGNEIIWSLHLGVRF
jgi:hypothetical protein